MTPAAVTLSVIVTTHAEGRLLRPTLRSVAAGLRKVVAAGHSAELVLVCDRIDEATRHEVDHWVTSEDHEFIVRAIQQDLGESGAARNAGAAAAAGEFAAYIDGDDLVSSDYFCSAIDLLQDAGESPLIVHPETVVSFGARSLVWQTYSTSSGDIDHQTMIRDNPWPSSSAARRTLYVENPYRSLPPGGGFGPEDWIWNLDTAAAGIPHDVAPDSLFFYRVREHGGVNNRHARSILPFFDIDALRAALPSRAAAGGDRPATLAGRVYQGALPSVRRLTSRLTPDERKRIYTAARWLLTTARGERKKSARSEAPTPQQLMLRESCEIEPAISWTAFHFDDLPRWRLHNDDYVACLTFLVDALRGHSDAIVAVPWVGVGGADLVSINYAQSLGDSEAFRGKTSILATSSASKTRRELVPTNVTFVQAPPEFERLDPQLQRRLIAQVVILLQPALIVSVNSFHVTHALQTFGAQMTAHTRIFSTLFAFDRIGHGYPVNTITDDSHRHAVDELAGIITDNSVTASLIHDILALDDHKTLVHHQPAFGTADVASKRSGAAVRRTFDASSPFRLLWPHRLDEEKRPDVVAAIARSLRARGVNATIDVWGSAVLTSDGSRTLADLKDSGVDYRGAYSGGLSALPLDTYDALLLTSQSEGLPLVLVQSLALGLPVIATAVGGVPDIIHHRRTGLLVSGPDDVDGFVDSIILMMEDADLRVRLIEGGAGYVAENHSWEAFSHVVEHDLIAGAR